MMSIRKLQLELLHERHIGLTAALSGALFEAASVCLKRHHDSPVAVEIACGSGTTTCVVEFQNPTSRVINAWANDLDTTEWGAYCVCLAAVESEEQLVAVKRAETFTGADYYVAPIGTEPDDLEHCMRLEVSGVDAGDHSAIETRLRQKVDQTRRGTSNLPAIASVVGFKEKAIAIQRVGNVE
jgi:hypothetical protein